MAVSKLEKRYLRLPDYISKITSLLEKLYTRSTRNPLEMLVDDLWCEFGQKHPAPLSKEEREILFEATNLYGQAVASNPFEDILGPIYMELAGRGHKKAMGQFFTPTAVCDLMSAITLGDELTDIIDRASRNEPTKICEPCCGAGAILMSTLKHVMNKNPELLEFIEIWGVDKERLCARMCGVQILCNCLVHRITLGALCIVHGDALTVEQYETIVFAEHRGRQPYTPSQRWGMIQSVIDQQQAHWQTVTPQQPTFPIAI